MAKQREATGLDNRGKEKSWYTKPVCSKITVVLSSHTRPQFDGKIPADRHYEFTTSVGHTAIHTTTMTLQHC